MDNASLSEQLVEHADQLLAGTGLACARALAVLAGTDTAAPDADPVVLAAIRAGWSSADLTTVPTEPAPARSDTKEQDS